MTAALAHSPDHLLVGKHGAQGRAPVDRRLRLVSEPVIVAIPGDGVRPLGGDLGGDRQLGDRPALLRRGVEPRVEEDEEDPLRPADVAGIGRCQHAIPVVTEAEHLQLPREGGDVPLRALPRRRAGADGVLFGGQAEGIEAHRVHHARAAHPLEPRHDVGGRVALRVADVQAVAAGIGKHVEDVPLAAGRQSRRGEGVVRLPPGLPLRFDAGRLVAGHGGIRRLRPGRGRRTDTVPAAGGGCSVRRSTILIIRHEPATRVGFPPIQEE